MNLEEMINDGWDIEFSTVRKRVGDLNNRRFEDRVTWEAKIGEHSLKSEWEGFVNAQLCIEDMCEKVSMFYRDK